MSKQHTLKNFDKNLQSVRDKVLGMAEMVRQELADCMQAFADRDQLEAYDAEAADVLINSSERIIDNLVVSTIVLHQPVASDCRELIAALRISRDLERIGDYATNIADHSITLDQLPPTGKEKNLNEMGQAVQAMLDHLINAYILMDGKEAETIRQQDVEVDQYYTEIFSDLVAISGKQPDLSNACTHQVLVGRSLERIGDHITDMAEEILFVVNGEFPEDDRTKADGSAFVK